MTQEKKKVVSTPIGLQGELHIEVKDKYGRAKKLWQENRLGKFLRTKLGLDLQGWSFLGQWTTHLVVHNLITSAGKAGVASRINGSGAEPAFAYLALGTGTTPAAAGNTTLETELSTLALARALATLSRVTTNVTNDTAQLDYTWTASGTAAITEAGAFNANAAGVLLGRQVFSAVNVGSGDSFQLIYKFVVSA